MRWTRDRLILLALCLLLLAAAVGCGPQEWRMLAATVHLEAEEQEDLLGTMNAHAIGPSDGSVTSERDAKHVCPAYETRMFDGVVYHGWRYFELSNPHPQTDEERRRYEAEIADPDRDIVRVYARRLDEDVPGGMVDIHLWCKIPFWLVFYQESGYVLILEGAGSRPLGQRFAPGTYELHVMTVPLLSVNAPEEKTDE